MVGEFLVLLLVALEMLLLATLQVAMDIHLPLAPFIRALQHQELLVMRDVLAVDCVAMALAEGELVDSVQQVGLAHAIIAHEAVDLRRKRKIRFPDILVIEYTKAR